MMFSAPHNPLRSDVDRAGPMMVFRGPGAPRPAALVGHARENGGEVRAGVGVVGIERDARGVDVVLTTGDKLRTRYVIAADGHYSAVRRLVGDQVCDLGTWHAFRQYVLE